MAARYSSEPEVLMFFELGWNGVTGGPRNADSAQIKVEVSKQPPSSTGFFSDAAKDARRFKAQEADAVRTLRGKGSPADHVICFSPESSWRRDTLNPRERSTPQGLQGATAITTFLCQIRDKVRRT